MKKFVFLFVFVVIMLGYYFFTVKNKSDDLKIGIILPMQHQALNDIVNGFLEEIKNLKFKKPIKIDVQNANQDINIQRTIINKFINEKVDFLVPIATSTSQMTIELAQNKIPVLSLASVGIAPSEKVFGVTDDISLEKTIKFLQELIPNLKKLTILYSSSDKVFKEVEQFENLCKSNQISLQKLMIQTISDIYTVSKNIQKDSDAIFILKDNLLASGILVLVQKSHELKIPLITSDEGTVKNGATIALGLTEEDIGKEGAKMLFEYFQNQKKQSINNISNLKIFINKKSFDYYKEKFIDLKTIYKKLNFDIVEF